MATTPNTSAAPGAVILVDDIDSGWQGELEALLRRYGYRIARIRELAMAPYLLISGGLPPSSSRAGDSAQRTSWRSTGSGGSRQPYPSS